MTKKEINKEYKIIKKKLKSKTKYIEVVKSNFSDIDTLKESFIYIISQKDLLKQIKKAIKKNDIQSLSSGSISIYYVKNNTSYTLSINNFSNQSFL